MGSFTPGATYIYEHNGEEIYAREAGKTIRTMIPRIDDGRPLHKHILEDKLWGEIRRAAKQTRPCNLC